MCVIAAVDERAIDTFDVLLSSMNIDVVSPE
jgi:hypothetical protein